MIAEIEVEVGVGVGEWDSDVQGGDDVMEISIR